MGGGTTPAAVAAWLDESSCDRTRAVLDTHATTAIRRWRTSRSRSRSLVGLRVNPKRRNDCPNELQDVSVNGHFYIPRVEGPNTHGGTPMMRLRIGIALMAILALGCSAKQLPSESPLSVSPLQFQSNEIRQPDQVIVITDASGTMYDHKTFPLAKALTQTFIAAMPEANAPAARPGGYSVGLISFGGDERIGAGLAPLNRGALANTAASYRILGEVGGFGGRTPYRNVLAESRAQLAGKSAHSALVIFSDGIPDSEERTMASAKALIKSYRGSVCIHTVQTGDDPAGALFLDRLSKLTGCGSTRSAASIHDSGAFMQFTRKVFAGQGAPPPWSMPAAA